MKINISDVLNKENTCIDIEFNDKVEGLEDRINSYDLYGNVIFSGALKKAKGEILELTGLIKYEYDINCYRCLKNIHRSMNIKVNENILNARSVNDEDDVFTYEGDYLDLDIILKNYIILSLPMKQVCSNDCKGLCPICGKNLNEKKCDCTEKNNINPQMEILRNYFE
jgi:uncharacterized protein